MVCTIAFVGASGLVYYYITSHVLTSCTDMDCIISASSAAIGCSGSVLVEIVAVQLLEVH